MFGLISKKKLIEVAVDAYLESHLDCDMTMNEYRFRCGFVSGLCHLCSRFGINLDKEAKKAKERGKRDES